MTACFYFSLFGACNLFFLEDILLANPLHERTILMTKKRSTTKEFSYLSGKIIIQNVPCKEDEFETYVSFKNSLRLSLIYEYMKKHNLQAFDFAAFEQTPELLQALTAIND